ncbi:MAG TPA: amidohydrolase family protein [Bryobacteraceae bacterium]|nr:amidohydrolase family protein [Bryobacteraceae bacterium]
MNRRTLLTGTAAAMLSSQVRTQASGSAPAKTSGGLLLKDFQPRSMLHVAETHVPRAKFPVIDIHTHLCWAAKAEHGVPLSEERTFLATPAELLKVMDHSNLKMLVNVTGGMGSGLRDSVARLDRAHPGRFLSFTEPWWARTAEPGYAQFQADELGRAKQDGARGLKLLKTLGLYLRDHVTTGKLIKVDDPRFDPMWEACAALNLPVAIHVSDPEAFFLPIDRFNERYEELNNHPDWSFHGGDFPSNAELLEARNRVFARHPKTQFITLHVGNDSENLGYVGECMDKYPNMYVDIAARVGELGRQPRTSRKFFEKYQDRILFGTDATPHGDEFPQQVFVNALYEIYYRYLETEDEYFDYAPAAIPPQGRWRIYGIGLPDEILRKVYHDNAARLLGLPLL